MASRDTYPRERAPHRGARSARLRRASSRAKRSAFLVPLIAVAPVIFVAGVVVPTPEFGPGTPGGLLVLVLAIGGPGSTRAVVVGLRFGSAALAARTTAPLANDFLLASSHVRSPILTAGFANWLSMLMQNLRRGHDRVGKPAHRLHLLTPRSSSVAQPSDRRDKQQFAQPTTAGELSSSDPWSAS